MANKEETLQENPEVSDTSRPDASSSDASSSDASSNVGGDIYGDAGGDSTSNMDDLEPTRLEKLGNHAKQVLERSMAKDPDDESLEHKAKTKLIKVLAGKQEDADDEPKSDTYVLLTTEQDPSSLRDIPGAFHEPGLIAKWNALFEIYQHHRIGRAVNRYLVQRGKLAAGGISFMAVFSMAGLATVGWTLFALFFSARPDFQQAVADTANNFIPGIVATPSDPDGLLNPADMVVSTGTVVTGVTAFLVALWAASRVVRYLADGIRSMFGLLTFPGRAWEMYPRYMLGLLLLLGAVLTTAVLTLLSDHLLGWLTNLFSIHPPLEHTFTYEVITKAVPMVMDVLVFYVLVRVAAGVKVPSKTLWTGAAGFALASLALSEVGGALIHSTSNPITAAATTLVTVLVWINVLSRIALIIAAWMANPPAIVTKVDGESIHLRSEPNYVSVSAPQTLNWPHHPISGDLIPADALTISEAQKALTEANVSAEPEKSDQVLDRDGGVV